MKKSALVLIAIVISSPANGMVYTWKDIAGVKYFTNKEYEIPTRYRARAKALYPEQVDSAALTQNAQVPPASPNAPPPVQQIKPEVKSKENQVVIIPVPQRNLTNKRGWEYGNHRRKRLHM